MEKESIKNLLGLKKRFGNYLTWGILVFLALFIGLYFKSTNTILVVTGLIIFFYTYETYKMRKEIANQTKILSSPFVSVFIETDITDLFKREKLWVRNDGEVTARNIQLDSKELLSFYGGEEVISFRSVDTLPKGETKELKIERISKKDDNIAASPLEIFTRNFLKDLKNASLTKQFSYKLRFKNIFDESYHADVIFRDEEFLIRNFRKE